MTASRFLPHANFQQKSVNVTSVPAPSEWFVVTGRLDSPSSRASGDSDSSRADKLGWRTNGADRHLAGGECYIAERATGVVLLGAGLNLICDRSSARVEPSDLLNCPRCLRDAIY